MIGLLDSYHIDKTEQTYQKEYGEMFVKYLNKILPNEKIKLFAVAQNEFPTDINQCDSWIITGSPASTYEDKEWINTLSQFIRNCHQNKKKMLGICFGHQLIAQALGGKVALSDKGWGVGIIKFNIIAQAPWMNKENNNCSLLFSHRDQVTNLPTDAELLATNEFCPNQMYKIGNYIFSIQGHPEFTREFAKGRYDAGIEQIGKKTHEKALYSLTNNISQQVDSWIKKFLTI